MALTLGGQIENAVERSVVELNEIASSIHSRPELAFQETFAAKVVAASLERHGFDVARGVADLPTSVIGRFGTGTLKVALFAEYDALPSLGHACGHNLIAASAIGAGIGLAEVAASLDVQVVVVGSPAEERGGGKIQLLEAGFLDGVHLAMMVHPAPFDVVAPPILALHWIDVAYRGRAAHASAFPELGINAADAAVIAQTAVGLARQHISPRARVHGIVTNAGTAANVIPDRAELSYMIRAPHLDLLDDAVQRVVRCFEAGAVATGAELILSNDSTAYAHMEHDDLAARMYRECATLRGRTFFDGEVAPVSTDMGNVSLAIPSIHPFIGIGSGTAVNHQAEFAVAANTTVAMEAMVDGAVSLACTAARLASTSEGRVALQRRAAERWQGWQAR